ncbi:hypothetical protein Tco_0512325 [Tanacetum coccineum]
MSEYKKQVKKIARRVWTEVEVNLKRNADSYLFDLVHRGWKPFKKNPPRGYIDDFNRKGFIPSLVQAKTNKARPWGVEMTYRDSLARWNRRINKGLKY